MGDHDRSSPKGRSWKPSVDGLEGRMLLTANQTASEIALVTHEYDGFVSVLKQIELQSQATTAEYLALRDDARAISQAASAAPIPGAVASPKAVAVSIQLDLAPLEGWLGTTGWAQVQTTLTANLNALDVPQSLIGQTLSDMKAMAASAGVTAVEYASYSSNLNHLKEGEASLQGNYAHFPDPNVYYTQHLRGFFRDFAVDKSAAQATLKADLTTIGGAVGSGVLRRDTNLLESIGAGIPSADDVQLGNEYAAAFDSGSPSSATLQQLGAEIETTIGAPGSAPTGSVARLLADAPAFYRAAGSDPTKILGLVVDVRSVVDLGGDSRLNPFVVTIH